MKLRSAGSDENEGESTDEFGDESFAVHPNPPSSQKGGYHDALMPGSGASYFHLNRLQATEILQPAAQTLIVPKTSDYPTDSDEIGQGDIIDAMDFAH